MSFFKVWTAAGLLCVSTGVGATATFDGGTGLLTLSAVKVGSATYTHVVLALVNPANYTFQLQTATPQTPAGPADITFDASTGLLSIPSVTVGGATYVYVALRLIDANGYVFALKSATLLAPSAEAAGVRHRTIAAWSSGGGGFCVLLRDGTARCLGSNTYGTLGVAPGTNLPFGVPVQVPGLSGALQLAAGNMHLCALVFDGSVWCWGRNSEGQVGSGTFAAFSAPVAVSGVHGAVAVAAGYNHSCALLGDGTVRCWGDDTYGQLGDGRVSVTSATPVVMVGASNVVSIGAGGHHTCIVVGSVGTVQCLGNGQYGVLGNNSGANAPALVTALGVAGAVGVYGTADETCALFGAGNAACWGFNNSGGLGNGTLVSSGTATAVKDLANAISLTNGDGADDHKCAVLSDGTLRCWGPNATGALGNGTFTGSTVPVSVVGIDDAVAAAAGGSFSCAVRSDGTVWCWGTRTWGGGNTNVPQRVAGIDNAQ